ncbi:MAG: ABC transporter substrate-binding protein [Chloroflexi bacterium]|nr:ABC transporter substrate-binding protein [Chloroflexota bacterium]
MATSRDRRRYSRRWFLGALGASAGAAGLAALGCDDDEPPPPEDPTVEPTEEPVYPTYPSTPAPDPTRAEQTSRHGGTLRYAAAFSSDEEFDPHRTTSAALLGQQALIYSRLVTYESQVEGTLTPDLAMGMPEQPDELTYIFELNPEARWHDVAPLDGRAVTAGDVLASIERQRTGRAQDFPRRGRWDPISSMEAPDDRTVIARSAEPFAGTLARFASPEGLVIPLEVEDALSATLQVGSGPFRWIEWSEGSYASVARNEAWHGPEDGPFLDGISTVPPRSIEELEADFRTRQLDAVEAGFLQAEELKRRLPDLREARSAVARFYGMRFLSSFPPYDDPRLRRALTVAIDRREMLERFFNGSGTLNPWISAGVERWSLPQTELQRQPGYLPGSGGREQDKQDARTALAAYRAEQELEEPLELLVTFNLEETLGMAGLIAGQLRDTLQLDVQVTPVGIRELAQRLSEGEAPWAVGIDNGWIELDDWLYPYFHSSGSGNTFVLRDEALDAKIEEQRAEMSVERRQQIGYEVQRRLLELNVGANFVSEDVVTLSLPYVQLFPIDAGEAYQDRFARTWIDRTHPSFV